MYWCLLQDVGGGFVGSSGGGGDGVGGVDRSRINCIFRKEAAEEEGDEGELERLRNGKYIPSRRIVHLGEQLHSIFLIL